MEGWSSFLPHLFLVFPSLGSSLPGCSVPGIILCLLCRLPCLLGCSSLVRVLGIQLHSIKSMHARYEHDRGEYRSVPQTAGIFGTFPSPHLSYAGGIFDQFLGTALLLICICAITDRRNMKVRKMFSLISLFLPFPFSRFPSSVSLCM